MATKKEPLIVYVAKESDGYTYALSMDARRRLSREDLPMEAFGRLFLAQDLSQDFALAHRPILKELLPLLTKRSLDELVELAPVELRDYDERVLLTWPEGGSSARTPAGTAKRTAPSPRRPRP